MEHQETSFSLDEFHGLKLKLEVSGPLGIKIVSGSMEPLLPIGTIAQVEFCRFDDLKPMDLLVYWRDDRLTCHAVWNIGYLPSARGDRTVITRGLGNPEFDYPVAESEIFGRVTSHRLTAWQALRMSFFSKLRRLFH
jgi:hypothetical protein